MATSANISVEEYLRTTYHPDMEFVDGELAERHVGEHWHSRLQTLLTGGLLSKERGRFHGLISQRLLVSGNKHRYRIPDVCVMALPYRSEPVLTSPPHLVIEIVSPEDQTADMLAKVAGYLRFGVPRIWIPDPYKYKRTLQEADSEGIRPRPDLVIETELLGRVDFRELFSQLGDPTE
jgi:Uma2 family endonuclease